jgi:hypothetical protein
MQTFIVSGLVPGTDIQITFFGWIILSSAMMVAVISLWLMLRHHILRNWIIVTSVIVSTHRRLKI